MSDDFVSDVISGPGTTNGSREDYDRIVAVMDTEVSVIRVMHLATPAVEAWIKRALKNPSATPEAVAADLQGRLSLDAEDSPP